MKIEHIKISPKESWLLHQRLIVAAKYGLKLEDIPEEPDNDPASAEEATA